MTSCQVVRNAEGYVVTCSEEAEYPRVAHRDVTEYYCGIWTGGELHRANIGCTGTLATLHCTATCTQFVVGLRGGCNSCSSSLGVCEALCIELRLSSMPSTESGGYYRLFAVCQQ